MVFGACFEVSRLIDCEHFWNEMKLLQVASPLWAASQINKTNVLNDDDENDKLNKNVKGRCFSFSVIITCYFLLNKIR